MTSPTTYGKSPIDKPPGSLGESLARMLAGIDKNFSLIQSSIASIAGYAKSVAQSVPEDVSARVYALERGAIATYTTDPGDPAEGKSVAFVLVDPGVGADFIVRNNDGGTVREFIQALS